MTAIRIEGLRKSYGAVHALDGLDLTVEAGSIFGFLGPNGAGKTTTIRILTGLAHATEGRVWIAEKDIRAHRGDLARRIGYLPEEPAFYPWMTPPEFLDHVARLFELSTSARVARVNELLELFDLADVRKRRIGGFSRGMRQRLGLAQALVNRPELLFLDEPVSALDPAGRKDVLGLIESLRGQCTVFMSSHILADVERVCDTIGIIARGRLLIKAPRESLLAQVATPVFEVATEAGSEKELKEWAASVSQKGWASSVSVDGFTARIPVQDIESAKRELLPSALQAGLVLTRFELLKPSLEDIFLRLVGDGDQEA